MRCPNEIVPAITRKSIENIQQLLQSQFTYTDRIVSPFSLCSEREGHSALDHLTPACSLSLGRIWSVSNKWCSTIQYLGLEEVCYKPESQALHLSVLQTSAYPDCNKPATNLVYSDSVERGWLERLGTKPVSPSQTKYLSSLGNALEWAGVSLAAELNVTNSFTKGLQENWSVSAVFKSQHIYHSSAGE